MGSCCQTGKNSNGGKILKEKALIGPNGFRAAVIVDSGGNRIAFLSVITQFREHPR